MDVRPMMGVVKGATFGILQFIGNMQSLETLENPTNPLKRRFQTMMNDSSNNQEPRPYQLDVFKVAMRRM
ncbi:hypothetical protein L6452_09058 [Arctium lappa]|uniref:Uncharacterized protein n=1 Tax=Arctium lappa TaxID=4217 RepID=A0ACB9DJK1_ARCLA|nr:hypothetical protein L6452_09058 [Arctium lappa]